jgi:hypothetical protein
MVLLKLRKWTGQHDDWTCPLCRVRNLPILQARNGVLVIVPHDLAEDLNTHFQKHGQPFETEDSRDGSSGFFFSESGTRRIQVLLDQWSGLPYVFRTPTVDRHTVSR